MTPASRLVTVIVYRTLMEDHVPRNSPKFSSITLICPFVPETAPENVTLTDPRSGKIVLRE